MPTVPTVLPITMADRTSLTLDCRYVETISAFETAYDKLSKAGPRAEHPLLP
jgi:hypothetical protein